MKLKLKSKNIYHNMNQSVFKHVDTKDDFKRNIK